MRYKVTRERDYLQGKLETVDSDPFKQFQLWLDEAEAKITSRLCNAMLLSTCVDGQPHSRIVLLKECTDEGFVFYTNYLSAKGRAMSANPHVSLTFWWDELERQVQIEGVVEKVAAAESEAYFHSRDKSYQLGALASKQSEVLPERKMLEDAYASLAETYAAEDAVVPRPEGWGGYLVKPTYVEFWQGREHRLHDRFVYESKAGAWETHCLFP